MDKPTKFKPGKHPQGTGQAYDAGPDFDSSPEEFRKNNPDNEFVGASGVLFEQAMAQTRMAICLTDPHAEDMPIVFANRAFRELTGYAQEEIVGRNCRFLQGPDTDMEQVGKIRTALETHNVTVVELLNYRKNGETFWNALHIGPIYNEAGELIYFFGSQWDVSDVRAARAEELYAKEMARELSHRMKNMFAVISGIVNITGRMRGVESQAREINNRVQALGRAYETTLDEASSGNIQIGEAIHAILEPYDLGTGRLELLGNGLKVPFNVVSGVGLTLHELAANAEKHGAWVNKGGKVWVDWKAQGDDDENLVVTWRERGGPDVVAPEGDGGSGNAIIDRLVRHAGGNIQRDWTPEGLEVRIEFPAK
ncbi:PAS domain-containing protein [Aurantiacibacter poecillastricola]|uniref:PAS domain-containing protein n=1 Tax=Aurantiacibacter poecillastricola TaxID=3064385 RepID=UPI0027402C2E|nr:PAS domain-containing protein [Aurantiacibacter sp. 219JJ12-13]MDP5262677.1 PAS domain-containing protein [Aurantiacibacter sp. 219JJ12-13]